MEATVPPPPHEQRINDAQSKGIELIYGIFIGMLLVMIAIWIGSTLFSDTEGYLTNVFTEVISVIATIFVIDRINQWRDDRRLKNQLLEDLKSSSTSPAVNALDRLRREGWLDEDYFTTEKGKNLQRANWEGAYIGGLNFEGADLLHANFKQVTNYDSIRSQKVNFKDAILYNANLQEAALRKANLHGVRLNNANLKKADLWNANLQEADLREANLQEAHLQTAYLQNARLDPSNLKGANLVNAHMQKATLVGASLQGAILAGANLQEAILAANLQDAFLADANLQDAHLSMANLRGASLRAANLQGADFWSAKMQGADLRVANIDDVKWATKDGRYPATLPDGTKWTEDVDMERFTNLDHPEFNATLDKINEIRAELGYEPLKPWNKQWP